MHELSDSLIITERRDDTLAPLRDRTSNAGQHRLAHGLRDLRRRREPRGRLEQRPEESARVRERGLRLADDFRELGGRERELVRRVVRRVRVRGRADLS